MNGKAFFDTNILTCAVDRKDRKKEDIARRPIRLAAVRQDGVVSYQALQEFLNVGFKKFLQPLTPDKGHLYLAAWTANFSGRSPVTCAVDRGAASEGTLSTSPV